MTLFLISEKVTSLFFLFRFGSSSENGFEGVRVKSCVVDLGGEGHGSGGEILDLLKFKMEAASFGGEEGHVFFLAAGVGRDEIGNELLAAGIGFELTFVLKLFELFIERFELSEGGLAHEGEYFIACVFGGYLEAAGNVVVDDFAKVGLVVFGGNGVLGGFGQKVVTNAAADEGFLDAG